MTVVEIAPEVDQAALLTGAQFVDAYSIAVDGGALNARQATERMITRQPRWAEALLMLRNILVKPFGLKTSGAGGTIPKEMIGNIPDCERDARSAGCRISTTAIWIFASWSMLRASGDRQEVTATTLVLTHNWLGRTYLAYLARSTGSSSAPCCGE